MSKLPSIKKPVAPKKSYFDDSESDVDDDGNPLTVNAALRVHHGDSKTTSVYCPKPTYDNPMDAFNQLSIKKGHI